jgi:hypothetical protein
MTVSKKAHIKHMSMPLYAPFSNNFTLPLPPSSPEKLESVEWTCMRINKINLEFQAAVSFRKCRIVPSQLSLRRRQRYRTFRLDCDRMHVQCLPTRPSMYAFSNQKNQRNIENANYLGIDADNSSTGSLFVSRQPSSV